MGKVFLRCFVQTNDSDDASAIASELSAKVGKFAKVETSGPVPYWKMEGHHEVVIRVASDLPENTLLKRTALALGAGWQWLGELEAVWNKSDGGTFCRPEVSWAHVEVE